MKKLVMVVFLFAVVASAGMPVEDETMVQGPGDPTPARIKAQLIAGMNITRYEATLRYDWQGDQKYGEIIFDDQLRAEYIMIDGVTLFDDPENPTAIIPRPQATVENFYFHLAAYDRRDVVMVGDFSDERFCQTDTVTVQMRLLFQGQFMSFDVPDHVDPENIVVLGNPDSGGGPIGRYNQDVGMLEVWLNPDWGIIEFTVIDTTTGEVLAVGEVSPLDGEVEDDGYGISTRLEEGIEVIDMRSRFVSHKRLPGRSFDTVDTLYGREYIAKVFVLKRQDVGDTWMHFDHFNGFAMAYEWVGAGESEWALPFYYPENSEFQVSCLIPGGPERIIIVLYADYQDEFEVVFAKWSTDGKG